MKSRENLAEFTHPMLLLAPQSYSGATDSDVFSMKNHRHASIGVWLGATDADAGNITVEECTAADGTGATAIAFTYYKEETANGDTLSSKQAATTSGIDATGNDNVFYIIELDAAELSADSPFVRVALSAPGGAQLGCITVHLTGGAHKLAASPTAQS